MIALTGQDASVIQQFGLYTAPAAVELPIDVLSILESPEVHTLTHMYRVNPYTCLWGKNDAP